MPRHTSGSAVTDAGRNRTAWSRVVNVNVTASKYPAPVSTSETVSRTRSVFVGTEIASRVSVFSGIFS